MRKLSLDSIVNSITGVGDAAYDFFMNSEFRVQEFARQEYNTAYRSNHIIRKVVDYNIDEAFRQGIYFDTENDAYNSYISERIEELDFLNLYIESVKDARLYGGAGLLLGADDGNNLIQDLDLYNIRKIEYLSPFHRFQVRPKQVQNKLTQKGFLRPISYEFKVDKKIKFVFNTSRSLINIGNKVPKDNLQDVGFFGDSLVDMVSEIVLSYASNLKSIGYTIDKANRPAITIPKLQDYIMNKQENKLMERLNTMQKGSSFLRMMILGEGEKLDYFTPQMGGIKDLLGEMKEEIASAADMPQSVLFRRIAAFKATGEHDTKHYNNKIKSEQVKLSQNIIQFIKLLCAESSGDINNINQKFEFKFNPIEQLTKKEELEIEEMELKNKTLKSENEGKILSNIMELVDRGVILEDEVRKIMAKNKGNVAQVIENILLEEGEKE